MSSGRGGAVSWRGLGLAVQQLADASNRLLGSPPRRLGARGLAGRPILPVDASGRIDFASVVLPRPNRPARDVQAPRRLGGADLGGELDRGLPVGGGVGAFGAAHPNSPGG